MERHDEEFSWHHEGVDIRLGMTRMGSGETVLLLPALSSISTRAELLPLQRLLAPHAATVSVDWPGFGTLPRPARNWRPEDLKAFLHELAVRLRPAATVAAGHAAGYALAEAAATPRALGALSLLSPTWRGPLPTMTGRRLRLFRALAQAVDLPVVGTAFYRLNVNRPVIGMMMRGHVYADPAFVTPELMQEKLTVTEAPGARHASFRFVTGELDPFDSREAMLAAAGQAAVPVQVVRAAATPRKSGAEMAALASLAGIEDVVVGEGKLSAYEEHAGAVAPPVIAFLARVLGERRAGP
ncbi:alpha/beta fold hydrolase [Phreatobacter sp.]|uniref:alpha/beta fold hydrolase n=1 Tax=Phreatobacter sp. TaxID=1966341 RepID=UPI002601176F|nr:alpha/beta fold hydrolase [Phreatobacter sp.]